MKQIDADVCVIGAGSAGLSVAAGTSQLGLRTVLIEANRMGGDCLNTGCVPSKAMLALAKAAHGALRVEDSQIGPAEMALPHRLVHEFVHRAIATIAPHDSQARFEQLGATVVREHARFVDEHTVETASARIRSRFFVIAAGSRARIPEIAGLDAGKALTNETIFELRAKPEHLVIIGGGPIGAEMAQAHRRLGSAVTVIQSGSVLSKDEPELVEVVRSALRADGIDVLEQAEIQRVDHIDGGVVVLVDQGGVARQVRGSHLLVAAGRQANVDDLGLEQAQVDVAEHGIKVDNRLRTNRRHIFAIGDVIGGPQFTHVAAYHAGIVVRNLVFRIPAKVDYSALPWVTYTDPELAHVGLTEQRARDKFGDRVRTCQFPFERNDRAVTERRTEGLIKVVAQPNGKLLGASIVGPGAGEMIGLWCLALTRGLTLRNITDVILPYPTFGEVGKAVASEWYRPSLFSDRTRWVAGLLQKLPLF